MILEEVFVLYKQGQSVINFKYNDQDHRIFLHRCAGLGNLLHCKQIQQQAESMIHEGCAFSLDFENPLDFQQENLLSTALERCDKLRRNVTRVRLSLDWLRHEYRWGVEDDLNKMEALKELYLDSGGWHGDSVRYEINVAST